MPTCRPPPRRRLSQPCNHDACIVGTMLQCRRALYHVSSARRRLALPMSFALRTLVRAQAGQPPGMPQDMLHISSTANPAGTQARGRAAAAAAAAQAAAAAAGTPAPMACLARPPPAHTPPSPRCLQSSTASSCGRAGGTGPKQAPRWWRGGTWWRSWRRCWRRAARCARCWRWMQSRCPRVRAQLRCAALCCMPA